MQLGFTLFEEMRFSDGQVVNVSLADYKIPGMLDIRRDLTAELVEAPLTGRRTIRFTLNGRSPAVFSKRPCRFAD